MCYQVQKSIILFFLNISYKENKMKVSTYFESYVTKDFQKHLRYLIYQKPNQVIRQNAADFGVDEQTIFFGGHNWQNYKRDISDIPLDQKELFIISLFTIVVIDLNMHAHFREYYPVFRRKTMYPKFGWSGFGIHIVKPKKLLSIPVDQENLTFAGFDEHSTYYADYFFDSFDRFFTMNNIPITPEQFFQALLTDPDFQVANTDKNMIFEKLYFSLYNRLTKGD